MAGAELEKTPLWADIRDVLVSSKKPIKFEFRILEMFYISLLKCLLVNMWCAYILIELI